MTWHFSPLAVSAAALLLCMPVNAGLYSANSPVLQVTSKTYDKLIAQSNHTSIVEFYAPWCGHCKNLQPAYEKAAKSLAGLAKVAAVNCDEDENKPLCGQFGVQGFPTLKIVRPSKKPGKPVIEDYQGARAAKAIVDAVVEKIPNNVKRVTDKDVEEFVGGEGAKAILFTEKGTTSALIRALAIDYLGSISFAQIRNKEKKAAEKFGVTSFPKLVLVPGGDKEPVLYDGELKRDAIVAFLKQVASPNPDPKPEKPKAKKANKEKKSEKKAKEDKKADKGEKADKAGKDSDSKAGECPHKAGKDKAAKESASTEAPAAKPTEDAPPRLRMLSGPEDLQETCLTKKSPICILALLPAKASDDADLPKPATQALLSLAEVQSKHSKRGSIFPFYAVPVDNVAGLVVRETLGIKGPQEFEVIAVNAKRLWWRRYSGADFSRNSVENWIDAIRMNEGKKEKLPEQMVMTPEEGRPEAAVKAAKEALGVKDAVVDEKTGEPKDAPEEKVKKEEPIEKLKFESPEGLKVEVLDDEPVQPKRDEL
ncbi:thioredoxin-domain-containing protein [Trichodelitschia bisporula]|uniref:protein disulfide-isomerase n=1 Tax=Trichodelitschia bisporula TaxID=703511 RepID=A0A6G1I7B3_9PEZI|nr:thioredoxin-domain-containing protein [Trichodelitschia bisporula]